MYITISILIIEVKYLMFDIKRWLVNEACSASEKKKHLVAFTLLSS